MIDEISWSIAYLGMGYVLSASAILPGLMIGVLLPKTKNRAKRIFLHMSGYAVFLAWIFAAIFLLDVVAKSSFKDLGSTDFQKTLFGVSVFVSLILTAYILWQLNLASKDKLK